VIGGVASGTLADTGIVRWRCGVSGCCCAVWCGVASAGGDRGASQPSPNEFAACGIPHSSSSSLSCLEPHVSPGCGANVGHRCFWLSSSLLSFELGVDRGMSQPSPNELAACGVPQSSSSLLASFRESHLSSGSGTDVIHSCSAAGVLHFTASAGGDRGVSQPSPNELAACGIPHSSSCCSCLTSHVSPGCGANVGQSSSPPFSISLLLEKLTRGGLASKGA